MIHPGIKLFIDELGVDFTNAPIKFFNQKIRSSFVITTDYGRCHNYAREDLEIIVKNVDFTKLIKLEPKLYWGYVDFVYNDNIVQHAHSFLVIKDQGQPVVLDRYIYKLAAEGIKVINHKGIHLPYWYLQNILKYKKDAGNLNHNGYLVNQVFISTPEIENFTSQVFQT